MRHLSCFLFQSRRLLDAFMSLVERVRLTAKRRQSRMILGFRPRNDRVALLLEKASYSNFLSVLRSQKVRFCRYRLAQGWANVLVGGLH